MVNCPNCGTNNLDNATVCVNCGRSLSAGAQSYTPPPPPSVGYGSGGPGPGPGPVTGGSIPNYLWQSIVVTLCCCLPLGIVGIVFAVQVNQKLAAGDIAGAQDASNKAKMFTLIGFGIGIVVIILSLIVNGAMFTQILREAQANR